MKNPAKARPVSLRYIGRKPVAFDNITRSGKTWNGRGDVQEVTDAQAKQLLRFADQWELVNAGDAARVNAPVSITALDDDGAPVSIDPDALKKPLEQMSRPELRALAQERWKKALPAAMSTKMMIDQIEEYQATIG